MIKSDDQVYTCIHPFISMEQSQYISLKKMLQKNNEDALQFIHQMEGTLNSFEKSGNFSEVYSDVKKAILEYKDKIIN